ncbi:serine hydrolase domain-containing protein [Erythrobacter rubeus]|uniref:Beta-lactamase family protein n=1 Tax=Erythrobacter rubeus TaxID=2760803 RepID=A0ABR8KVE7_9SPHN|nr:serine hydrolase domain-containing protein [Erythrobacter rubeus]MBD2842101.1 beta-lactamase family protein [Erythrobacter rubeus]
MFRYFAPAAAAALAHAVPQGAFSQEVAVTSAAERQAKLTKKVPLWLAQHDVPSVGIAYIEDGAISFVAHFGDQSWGYPANDKTLYNVASLTKPITAEVVMRLVHAGRFALDTPLIDHHVEEDVADDPRSAQLTPLLVMRHKTGFPNWRYETEGTLRFLRDPDTEVGYSGEGYEWMMKAAASAAGEDFEKLAETYLFEPADMPTTSYTLSSDFPGRLAVPYKAGEAPYNVVRREPSASDDLRTTPREYANFMLSVFEGDDVSKELRAQQFSIADDVRYRAACKGEERADFCPVRQGWGLGWTIYEWDDRRIFEHSGGDHGERTLALYDPDARRGMVILTNGANGFDVIRKIVDVLDDDERLIAFINAPFG